MGRFLYRTLIGGAGLLASSTFAFAGEQALEFKFVLKLLDPKVIEAPNIDGQTMIASKGFGVAYFKDGRVAINDFIITYDLLKGSGPSRGYGTYTFEDGSSITSSITGERSTEGRLRGVYKIVSGTGAYANATGTGSFESVPTKFKDAVLLNGKFDVKTP
jgi:hypothetical protein